MLNSILLQTLQSTLNGNLARIKCFALLVAAVLQHRTVNLTILSTTADGKSCSTQSRYRRFQDFFLSFALDLPSIGKLVLDRLPKPKNGFVLAMDRTNWKFGRTHINFLVISCIVGKASIPLVWQVLPAATKRGNSDTKQRINLTNKLLDLVSAEDIQVLSMDREFVGKDWLSWLNDQGVAFVVRVKKCSLINGERAELLTKNGCKNAKGKGVIWELELYYTAKSLDKDNQLIIISNRFEGKEALSLYRLRWGIERLFGHLKKKGFDLESTHLSDPAKLEKLFAVLVVAFLFSYGWGSHLRASKSWGASAAAKRKSVFRLGLEDILSMYVTRRGSAHETDRMRRFEGWLQAEKFSSIFLV